jgi:hypothetical protein
VLRGPWRFEKEHDGLYVYPESGEGYSGPNERLWRERQAKRQAAAAEEEVSFG